MSDEDFELELLRNVSGEVKSRNLGRGIGNNEVPQLVRELVAETALDGASNKMLQKHLMFRLVQYQLIRMVQQAARLIMSLSQL